MAFEPLWKGPFVGHLAPGLGLLLWGAWWLLHALLPPHGASLLAGGCLPGGGDGKRPVSGVAAGRGGGGYVARGCFSRAELNVRVAASLLALATESASAVVNADGALRWLYFVPMPSQAGPPANATATGDEAMLMMHSPTADDALANTRTGDEAMLMMHSPTAGGEHQHGGNLQNFHHATMHVGLLLSCAAEAAERRLSGAPRGLGLGSLAAALALVTWLLAQHTALQGSAEALRHWLLCVPLAAAAAAAAVDVAAPRRALLLARAYGLALAGTWMAHMALSRQLLWEAPYEPFPAAISTVVTLHYAWYAMTLATAGVAAVVWAGTRQRTTGAGASAAHASPRDARADAEDAPDEWQLRRLMA